MSTQLLTRHFVEDFIDTLDYTNRVQLNDDRVVFST